MTPLAEAPSAPSFIRRTGEGEIRRANLLLGTGRAFAFAWAGQPAVLRFTVAEAAPAATCWFRVRLDDHSFDLGLPALPEPAALGVAFAGIEIAALPEELLLGVLEAWWADAAAALRAQGVAPHLEAQTAAAPGLPPALGWKSAAATIRAFSPARSTPRPGR